MEYPELRAQTVGWTGMPPPRVDWDGILEEVVERGRAVPEITWCTPGEDAAWQVLGEMLMEGQREGGKDWTPMNVCGSQEDCCAASQVGDLHALCNKPPHPHHVCQSLVHTGIVWKRGLPHGSAA